MRFIPQSALFRRPRPLGILVGAALWPALGVSAQSLEKLVERSPFAPPAASQPKVSEPEDAPAGPASQRFEFRGVVHIENAWQFSLFDREEDRGYWVGLDESIGSSQVVGYDAENRSLLISTGADTETLSLEETTRQAPRPPDLQNKEEDEPRRIVPRRRVVRPIPRPNPNGRS
ncbi:MAG: hypothetical protein ACFE0O_03065 [Opitutales bacterium]